MGIGPRLLSLRRAKGLSLRRLAAMVGVSAQAISKYERGLLVPRPAVRHRLAGALGVPTLEAAVAGLAGRPPVLELVPCARLALLARRELTSILAAAGEHLAYLETLERLVGTPTPATLPPGWPKSIRQARDIERAAAELREAWGLGAAPLRDVVELLEHQGLPITAVEGPPGFGAACLRTGPRHIALAVNPLIACTARRRLAVLHALSHALLRLWPDLDPEVACDRMARALLITPARAHAELGTTRAVLSPDQLAPLGRSYGLPTSAWADRALELEIIAPTEAARLQRSFKRRGWLTREPAPPPPPELPRRADRLTALVKSDPRTARLLPPPPLPPGQTEGVHQRTQADGPADP